jgi:HAD superfamily hydrolase (TIGR01549 family)
MLLAFLQLQEFSPALSREFKPYKPSAAPLLHICNTWGASPSEVLMVGDSAKDDVSFSSSPRFGKSLFL